MTVFDLGSQKKEGGGTAGAEPTTSEGAYKHHYSIKFDENQDLWPIDKIDLNITSMNFNKSSMLRFKDL